MRRDAGRASGPGARARGARRTLALLGLAATTLLTVGGADPMPVGAATDAAPVAGRTEQAAAPTEPVLPVTVVPPDDVDPEALPGAEDATAAGIGTAPVAESEDTVPAATGATATPIRPVLLVASGGSSAGSGRPLRYTVEVERSTGLDPDAVAAEVDAALGDPRSWSRDRLLERVADVAAADARVVIATPGTIDALCAAAGLDTAGVFSCWTGRVAALNSWRWENGAAGFPDVSSYRTYLVNHEVGHALGYGHRRCPGPGALAPVMMQQSKGLDGCIANGWPYP